MRTPFIIRFLSAMPRSGWIAMGLFALISLVVMPALHLLVPVSSPFHVSNYIITLGGQLMCYANGFTDFKRILGYDITSPEMRATLFGLSALVLMLTLLLGRYLMTSKYGKILTATRDAESRVMFIGYSPRHYKLFIWTLSAMLCAIAGALYVPQVGIINPGEMSPANSIEIAIWVAVGGRATLIGPVIGAGLVNLFKSFFTVAFPEYWLFFLGALFVGVTLWLPEGVVGLWKRLRTRSAR